MNIYGGFDFGIASPISGISSSGISSGGIAYTEPMVDYYWPNNDIATVSPISVSDTPKYEPGVATPTKVEPDTPSEPASPGGGISIALPGFDEGGTPHWEEHKVEQQPQQQGHLDVKKLLEGQTEGYKLYDDGEGGLTVDPNSKGGVYYGPGSIKSTAPKTKKQTATAALPEVSDIYRREGDDYSVDSNSKDYVNAISNPIVASISGSRGGGSKLNSNVNDAVFGGQSNSATPGYSLW